VQERAGGAVRAAVGNAVDSAVAPAKGALEVLGSAATGTGQAIMGGWRGLAALASGAGLDEAARQVHAPELAGGNTATAYEPAAGSPAAEANKVIGVPVKSSPALAAWPVAPRWTSRASPAARNRRRDRHQCRAARATEEREDDGRRESAREIVPAMARDTTNYDVPTYQRRGAKVEAPAAVESGGPMIELPKFTEPAAVAPQGKTFPPEQQAARAAVLQRVGIEDARHGEQIVRETGGTLGVDAQRSRRAGT
jgi:hypothetical protein